ncbi:MAG: ABC transporter ATP-binding protein [Clostridia bacterium]|nr:ABC transporter ATP-binding protein [Clostridia bacterium]
MSLLEVKNLRVKFKTAKGEVCAVNDVSFSIEAGKTLALVGESGSGKSVSAMSVLKLLDTNGYIDGGEILFDASGEGEKTDLVKLTKEKMRQIRGDRISMIFQEPMTALNPVLSIGKQLAEPFRIHRGMRKKEAAEKAVEMLRAVQIPNPERIMKDYPHRLSGGMRQRVMIAMALACKPRLLIADEPTTALDVTIQAQILRLMRELQKETGTAILFITHDLGVVGEMADEVAVAYLGQIVESAKKSKIFSDGKYSHPYTEGLFRASPAGRKRGEKLLPIPGSVPPLTEIPKGCKFSPRCPYCTEKCVNEEPTLKEIARGHRIRCHYPEKEERRSGEHAKLTLNCPS